jgi:phosphate:Na+ symporter
MKQILFYFIIGFGIFFLGMQLMRIGFNNLAANKLKGVLTKFTKTPTHGFLTGIIITMLTQSSTAVTVITIGLTHARLLAFPQTIGIILGTNIGTTFTTQIIALNIYDYALPLFLLGAVLWFLPNHTLRCLGLIFGGFGCIFFGMQTMQRVAVPLQHSDIFQQLILMGAESSIVGVLLGMVMTAAVQSSTAVTAITMSFIASSLIPLPIAIAVVLGSNVGTCVTGLFAAIGTHVSAKRVAWSHVLLNVAGVLLFTPIIPQLAQITQALSVSPSVQVAHAQTLFNMVCSLAVLPFAKPFARLMEWIIPEKS